MEVAPASARRPSLSLTDGAMLLLATEAAEVPGTAGCRPASDSRLVYMDNIFAQTLAETAYLHGHWTTTHIQTERDEAPSPDTAGQTAAATALVHGRVRTTSAAILQNEGDGSGSMQTCTLNTVSRRAGAGIQTQ